VAHEPFRWRLLAETTARLEPPAADGRYREITFPWWLFVVVFVLGTAVSLFVAGFMVAMTGFVPLAVLVILAWVVAFVMVAIRPVTLIELRNDVLVVRRRRERCVSLSTCRIAPRGRLISSGFELSLAAFRPAGLFADLLARGVQVADEPGLLGELRVRRLAHVRAWGVVFVLIVIAANMVLTAVLAVLAPHIGLLLLVLLPALLLAGGVIVFAKGPDTLFALRGRLRFDLDGVEIVVGARSLRVAYGDLRCEHTRGGWRLGSIARQESIRVPLADLLGAEDALYSRWKVHQPTDLQAQARLLWG
jgi:hypothetical protein